MAKIRTYSCPGCSGQFDYMQHPSTAPAAPRFCPLCGFDTAADDDAFVRAITAPRIGGSNMNRAVEATYRQMEGQAEERIRAAAEITGQPESDFADMKITNMKDNLRQGDIAAIELPPNPVSQRMAEMSQRGMPVGFSAGPEAGAAYAESVKVGPYAHSGLGTASGVKAWHRMNAGNIVKSGEQGKY